MKGIFIVLKKVTEAIYLHSTFYIFSINIGVVQSFSTTTTISPPYGKQQYINFNS